jgi:hypothetical protein
MLKSKYGINLMDDEQPFYFTWNEDKTEVQLIDNGVLVQVFRDGKWVDVPNRTLGRWEMKDITKDEFMKATGGVMPDVDPKDIIDL